MSVIVSFNQTMYTKFKVYVLGFLLILIFNSCNNESEGTDVKDPGLKSKDTTAEMKNEVTTKEHDLIIKKLQGNWKETEYPFRTAQFKNTTVKFTEEGVAAEPAFREFRISQDCPFKVNNIKNARTNDLFLVMAEAGTCEILMVSNDTLTLSGFNESSNSEYKIIYSKLE